MGVNGLEIAAVMEGWNAAADGGWGKSGPMGLFREKKEWLDDSVI